jgi:uncharacterized protein YggE
MRRVICSLAIVLLPCRGLLGQASTPPAGPQIVTTGQGEARMTPDRATVYIGVQTRAPTAAVAAADNARRQRAVLDTLRALGLGSDQLSTQNYSIYPESRFDKDSQQTRIVGYAVSNTVRAELKRMDMVGAVIDAALAKGANQISSLEFSSSNTDEARRSALTAAVARARADADAIARAAGGSLGALIEVVFGPSYVPPVRMMTMQMSAMAAPAATPVEPGEQTVRVSITARWAFQAGGAGR